MNRTIVAVGREYGSGGRIIAQKLAKLLRVPFYDREVIELVARETGLSEDFVRSTEERRTSGFMYTFGVGSPHLPIHDQVFIAESEIIRRAAAEGACVIVGRCAGYLLRENPDCLRVFVHAPLEDRMCRAREEYGVESDDLRTFVMRQDKARAAYYNYFTTGKWGRAQDYDLTINSSLGIDTAVSLIAQLAKSRKSSA